MTYLDKLVDYIVNTPHNTNAAVVKSLAERYAEEKVSEGGGDTLDKLITGELTEITSNVEKVGDYTFYKNLSLTTVDFPSATSIGKYAFYECSKLITVDSPLVTSIGNNAFDGCKNLITANFPLVTSIKPSAFLNCSKLTTANFPLATEIGERMFRDCSNLTTVDFPKVTSIGAYAFGGCNKLEVADFPSATSLGTYAFNGNCSLTALILRSETMATLSNTNAFNNCYHILGTVNGSYNPEGLKDGYIYVPRALINSYKTATNWNNFLTQFRALEDYTVDGTTTGELDPDKI